MSQRRLLVLAAVVTFSACSDSPTSPSTGGVPPPSVESPFAGTWTGTLDDESNGRGTLRLVLGGTFVVNDSTLLSGQWTATFADSAKNGSGRATLLVNAGRANMLLTPATRPACAQPFPPAGELIASDLPITSSTMRGPYQFAVCGGSVGGTLQLTRP
jgi:hypothetical protein